MSTATEFLDENKDKDLKEAKAKMTLEPGKIYRGKITATSLTEGTCVVQVDTPSEVVENCRWAVGAIFAPLLGYRLRQVPTQGTHVFILYGNPSFVIQVATADNPDSFSGNSATLTGEHTRPESGVYGHGMSAYGPTNSDLLEGEFELTNAQGLGMLFLSNVMAMTTGGKAKVEACLTNDMVRIVAERLDIHTDHRSVTEYNDGRLSSEEHAFSHQHEAELVAQDTAAADLRDNEVDVTERRDPVDLYTDRYRKYTGWLGNFIHEFIKDPAFTIGQLNSGNSSRYMGADGTILYRSLAEIAFEKVVRVQVPVRRSIPEDPEGTKEDEHKEAPGMVWDFSEPQHTAYQLRQYARFLGGHKALARFRGDDKDFEVYPESGYQEPAPDNADPDSPATEYVLRYSTIRIMRDGCILITDGWGATYYSGYGNIQLSSTNDIEMSAGRNIVMTSKDFFLRTKNNMEFTSDEGGIVFNSLRFMKTLVRKGSIWLKSDVDPGEGDLPSAGVFIDASKANVIISGETGVGILSKLNEVVIEAVEIFIGAKDFIKMTSASDIMIQARKNLYAYSRNFFNRVSDRFQINDSLSLTLGALLVDVEMDASRGLRALSFLKGPPRPQVTPDDVDPVGTHFGHIDVLDEGETGRDIPKMPIPDIEAARPFIRHHTNVLVTSFSLPTDGKSFTTNNYRPHAQFMVQDELGDETWDLTTTLEGFDGPRTRSSVAPWPGTITTEFSPVDAEDLNTPSSSDTWSQTRPTKLPIERKLK